MRHKFVAINKFLSFLPKYLTYVEFRQDYISSETVQDHVNTKFYSTHFGQYVSGNLVLQWFLCYVDSLQNVPGASSRNLYKKRKAAGKLRDAKDFADKINVSTKS